ncbi:hypothetical protein [Arthrobacter zhaoguopingii]|uniref:hypothetical protein n=1 Tax=Arthrobacter zhaoguopingii TaxID=2681491 RepID=UPI0031B85B68
MAAARAWTLGEAKMLLARAIGGHAMGAARPLPGAPRFAACRDSAGAAQVPMRCAPVPVLHGFCRRRCTYPRPHSKESEVAFDCHCGQSSKHADNQLSVTVKRSAGGPIAAPAPR